LREERVQRGEPPVAGSLQGVSKARVGAVLARLDLARNNCVDAVYALLDDGPSAFKKYAKFGRRFCDAATTAQIGAHIAILQRGELHKLDREGRDYWIKPLIEVGAVEQVFLNSDDGSVLSGHAKAKSPVSAYRLNDGFRAILVASEDGWPAKFSVWSGEEAARERRRVQAELAGAGAGAVALDHQTLIRLCREQYAAHFLPGYSVLYEDSADGERVDEAERALLRGAGLELTIADAMPDLLLWNAGTDALWVVEAVTSDGEVDSHKVEAVLGWARRAGKSKVDFTTAYPSWAVAAARQGKMKNIAPGTFVWIAEDGSKHWLAEAFDARQEGGR